MEQSGGSCWSSAALLLSAMHQPAACTPCCWVHDCRVQAAYSAMLQHKKAHVALQALKLVLYAGLVLRASQRCAARAQQLSCEGKCGQSFISDGQGGHCHCDYWCNNRNDCCGGTANKNELCPSLMWVLSVNWRCTGHGHNPPLSTGLPCILTCISAVTSVVIITALIST